MKFKKSLLSLILAAAMLITSACAQNARNTESDISASVSESTENEGGVLESPANTEASEENTDNTEKTFDTEEESRLGETEAQTTDGTSETASESEESSAAKTAAAAAETVSDTAAVMTEESAVSAEAASAAAETTTAASTAAATTAVTTTTTPSAASETSAETSAPQQTPVSGSGFQVKGTALYDANGNRFVMRGINHPHSWFQNQLETAIPAIAKTGANTVRVVLSDGQQWKKIPLEDVEKIIKLCKDNKLICILEVHDVTGKDEIEGLRKTAEYWLEIKSALIGNEAYVILNIANEWIGSWDNAKMWYDGYSEAIKTIRGAGINNTIMIDAPGWGQYAKPIDDYGEKLFNDDPNKNTMFSIHMYGTAGKSSRVISSNLQYATNHDLCVVVGEFGYNHSDGDVDEDYIMKYCTENDIGYLGWSWKGNGGGVEYLDIAEDWEGKVLSSDWGEKLINGENGIKATSVLCSVY